MALILQLLVVTTLVVVLNAVPVDHSESTTVGIRTLPARLDHKDHSKESDEDKSTELKRTSRETGPRQQVDEEQNKSTTSTTRPLLGSASRVARDIPQYNSGSSTPRYDSSSGLGSSSSGLGSARPYGSNSNLGSNTPTGSSSPYGSSSGLGSKTPYGSSPQTYSSSQSGSYQNSHTPLGQGTQGTRAQRDTRTEKPGPTLTPSKLGNSQHPQGQTKDVPRSRPARDSPAPPEKHEHKPEKPTHEVHHPKDKH